MTAARGFYRTLAIFCGACVTAWDLEGQARELSRRYALSPKAMRSGDAWMHARGAQRKRNGARGTSYGPGGQPGRRGMRQHKSRAVGRCVWLSPQERYAGECQFRQDREQPGKYRERYTRVEEGNRVQLVDAVPIVGDSLA